MLYCNFYVFLIERILNIFLYKKNLDGENGCCLLIYKYRWNDDIY